MAQTRNLRDSLRSIVPNWLSDRQGFNVGFAFLYVIALVCDFIVDKVFQGLAAAWPGAGTATAYYLLGQSRGFPQGSSEPDESYALRLRQWLDFWTGNDPDIPGAGSAAALAKLVQIALGNSLVVRVLDRHGNFVTCNADGSITKVVDTSWNWDESDFPDRADYWSDIWIVVYLTDGRWPYYTNLVDATWVDQWGNPAPLGSGMQVPAQPVGEIHSIVAQFKGAHTFLQAIIFTTNTSNFVPGALGSFPNGQQGGWSRNNGSFEEPTRVHDGTVRYWVFNNGA